MEIVKCANGHFYDKDSHESCPYCEGSSDTVPVTEPVTLPIDEENTESYYTWESVLNETKERGKFTGPVVGWVVAIDGAYKGSDFPLKTGRNFIGRSRTMDICLEDKTISRDRHAVIIYEPVSNQFLVSPGEASELFYLNDEVVLKAEPLKIYDVITVGKTHLVFVPLCTEQFHWVQEQDELSVKRNPLAAAEAAK